ncbi:SixA phosphatase family protein [Arenimonas caeni]|uniref:Histidine phosphatase family protein n=1 Tax=Arenimonas caeni TaxID=2058085 RepID=A0A2P6M778_9GAMM|nr:phosphoglycerate mutase family protein [Arenimonas caeni]PRH81837.1 histidine phosphatase family protein [Arenimonas caeni]
MTLLRLLMLVACLATALPAHAHDGIVVVVVRHAEKADDSRDPPLAQAGEARADALAATLAGTKLDLAVSTQFRRTRQTAAPAAAAAGIEVGERPIDAANAATYAGELARELRALPPGSTALVVGHSNTVPGIVEALSGQPAAPMPETEYDRYTVVVLDADGTARVITSRY